MDTKALLALCKAAEQSEDMDEVESFYQTILSEEQLSKQLSPKVINDTRWNRALNLLVIANWYLYNGYEGRPQPTRAHTTILQAIEEIALCKESYSAPSDKRKAESFFSELSNHKNTIELALEEKAAVIPELSL